MDSFIKSAEEMLEANRVAELGGQLEEWRKRKEGLMELSQRVVEKRLGQKEDVEPGSPIIHLPEGCQVAQKLS